MFSTIIKKHDMDDSGAQKIFANINEKEKVVMFLLETLQSIIIVSFFF